MPASPVLPTRPDATSAPRLDARAALTSLFTGLGLALLLAALIDIAVLWAIQREPNAQADFAAITTTLDSFSVVVIALAALGGATLLREGGRGSLRLLGTLCLIAGAAAGLLGLLLLLDYFQVRGLMQDARARSIFHATTLKGLALAGLYALFLTSAGVRALRGR
jgi:hypothetical protein